MRFKWLVIWTRFFELVFRTWRWTPVLRSKAGNTLTVLITVPMSFSVLNETKNCCLREVTVLCDALSSSICNLILPFGGLSCSVKFVNIIVSH